jgi:hypothetical protein
VNGRDVADLLTRLQDTLKVAHVVTLCRPRANRAGARLLSDRACGHAHERPPGPDQQASRPRRCCPEKMTDT